MNEHVRPDNQPLTTQAAEGLLRRKWSVAEIEAMVRAGILDEDERFELIGGEVVPMSPKGILHDVLKAELNEFWTRRLPQRFRVIPETTFRLDDYTFVEPDFVFMERSIGLKDLNPQTALVAVEVADSTLFHDRGRKTRLYNSFGLREVWVIDAAKRLTYISKSPGHDGYREAAVLDATTPLVLPFAPDIALRLADLPTD